MTDNGLAALAAALHEANIDCDYSRKFDQKVCDGGDGPHSIAAAAILGERGVFLPDGGELPAILNLSVRVHDQAATIATLRAALDRVRERVDGKRVTKVKAGEDRWQTGFRDGWNELLPTVLAIIDDEIALAAAKETP